ncbi:family 43 glycosylhydrolase [Ideonella alba]|uniref:Family 43 glycosylhydrolase n=1 Tax=Ideonella alba TaxID=2824118 RepID=A0A940YA05_9BURK|nr:family 43 glycosylhydrolase [Ideonella alba]MBQ0928902.1 family 43 glycosylhydrolase [Ideonella alba]
MALTRREALAAALGGTALPAGATTARGRGPEGQRCADLGDGRYLNPIVPGDHADPTVLKDGADYYMSFSSFAATPGAVIWHSRDLLNWVPITAALPEPPGTVWAMDLVRHQGRYFLYIPVLQAQGTAVYVVWADDIRGPWSAPIDLGLPGCIDPGHVVGEDGRRYLFLNGGRRVRLSDDGLRTDGPLQEGAWEAWRYPEDWVVEMFAPEGPKLLRRGGWFYLVSAVGGTAGPPTSHMVTLSRSRSVHGPWEHCPHNPIVRTRSADEPWWSRGHASLVEGPAGDWWMVYHGYENGFRTLGRQALLEPVQWTRDGWLRARGDTLSRPLPAPRGGQAGPTGLALSDDFERPTLGLPWSLHGAAPGELARRVQVGGGELRLRGKGQALADCSPLCCIVGDRRYEVTVEVEAHGAAHGGLALFYDERGHAGIGLGGGELLTYGYGQEQRWMRQPLTTPRLHLRLLNRDNVLTWFTSADGRQWQQLPWQMEVSGLHHNVFGGFTSLRLALFSAGEGELRFRRLRYRAL